MNAFDLIAEIAEQCNVYIDLEAEQIDKLTSREVRFASQPSWPFEYSIGQVVGPETISEDQCPEHEDYVTGHPGCSYTPEPKDDGAPIYLGEGSQIGYLPSTVKHELGW